MASKEEFEKLYLAAKGLDNNEAYCKYLDAVYSDSGLKKLTEPDSLFKDTMESLAEGRDTVGIKTPLIRKDRNRYVHGLKNLQEEVIKLKGENELKRSESIKHLEWAIGIIILLATLYYVYLSTVKMPGLSITELTASNINIVGNASSPPLLTFIVSPGGERPINGEVKFWINVTNQSQNTCTNSTFFYTRQICSYNVSERPYSVPCGSSIPPLTLNTPPIHFTVTSDIINHEVKNFLNETRKNHISSCEINQSVKVCASYECSSSDPYCLKNCSASTPILVTYNSS
ncbi:MAG: hypothetical protein KGH64_03290 [Candidatus Micrarchaeota archaeon]|nr:hypothetical protein [Candidatus Micrarchaeota archaeon]MDE1834337.1 hypothetical protein [Candidatus Micrarchaeota archaeon]MDE1859811.1 hypothetical protein [Candidatus Micrarchaeota archaeon]